MPFILTSDIPTMIKEYYFSFVYLFTFVSNYPTEQILWMIIHIHNKNFILQTDTENDENEQTSKKKRKSVDDEASEPTTQKRKSFLKLQEYVFKK